MITQVIQLREGKQHHITASVSKVLLAEIFIIYMRLSKRFKLKMKSRHFLMQTRNAWQKSPAAARQALPSITVSNA